MNSPTLRDLYQTQTRRYTEHLSLEEHRMIKRIRQLFNQGADIVLIERRGKLRVRQVGKAEG